MVAAQPVQKDDRRAGADAFVVERELADFQSAGRDSIFHRDSPVRAVLQFLVVAGREHAGKPLQTSLFDCRYEGPKAVARRFRRPRGGRPAVWSSACAIKMAASDSAPISRCANGSSDWLAPASARSDS